jgi:thiol:disulfide interchange protein DsbD
MPAWTPWSEARVQQTLQQGHPVFIDYTAKWCITCQVNKASTLKNARVLESFKSHQVQLFEADWTRQDPAITASLKALGRSGVPVYVIMSPQHEVRVLSEVLTPTLLLKELDSL